ncbi:hypothetical protein NMY22_g6620 [Coprinellus aureogranulatus]|nr:hypothetical protein NMY22_g6620 [Coprinellus aureogranulatus]
MPQRQVNVDSDLVFQHVGAVTKSTLFNHITADEFLNYVIDFTTVCIVDGLVKWDQPASESANVKNGLVKDVPSDWTYGSLAVQLMLARVGTKEVKMCLAEVACDKARSKLRQ